MATAIEEWKRVSQALDAALVSVQKEATEGGGQTFQLASDRYIIFSDHHKGARNRADDFQVAERAYNAALAYYYRMGYTLVVMGDVEELWEERPAAVLAAYEYTLKLEARFHRQGRYVRIWGNHDDIWEDKKTVARYLQPLFGPPMLKVRESLQLKVMDGSQELGMLFLAHGHQGTLESDRFTFVSKFFVRNVWRPVQRITGVSLNTPAQDWQLRSQHNIAMYAWAEKQDKLVLIAGHTHQPVFKSQSHEAQIMHQLAELEAKIAAAPADETQQKEKDQKKAGLLAAELEWIRAQEKQKPRPEAEAVQKKPCYFNTGCCSFRDGDITGIELAGGEIRLVRWPNDEKEPEPTVLARANLKDVF
ncbi:MAG: metallophosphoesterase family protein [Anaerolineae bacterium]|nr:metallophosphoesterase family protein [Anaerolineae bacterium]